MQKNKGGWGKSGIHLLLAFCVSLRSLFLVFLSLPDTHTRAISHSPFRSVWVFFSPFALTHTVQVGEREREREHLEEIKPSVFGHLRN